MNAVSELIDHLREEIITRHALVLSAEEVERVLSLLEGIHASLVHAGGPTRDVKAPGIQDSLELADERAATFLSAFIKDRTDDGKAS